MKRRILIIGSPLSGQDFLIGVEDDVHNFYRYVTSSVGGAYTNGEITYFKNPSKLEVQRALNACSQNEILTVYFSGHGGRDNGVDYICLNGREVFSVTSFLTLAKRHIVIIDACRTPIDTRGYGDVISGIGFHFPTEYSDLARKLYWNYINEAPVGGVLIFSTSENRPSIDSVTGGVYTKSLMTALHNWCYAENAKIITAHDIFQRSSKIMKRSEPLQVPKLQYHESINAVRIPFAVNTKAHLRAARSFSSIGSTAHNGM